MTEETHAPRRGRPPKHAAHDDLVSCVVTRRGDGKVHTGEGLDIETGADAVYSEGDEFKIGATIADALAELGYVHIQK